MRVFRPNPKPYPWAQRKINHDKERIRLKFLEFYRLYYISCKIKIPKRRSTCHYFKLRHHSSKYIRRHILRQYCKKKTLLTRFYRLIPLTNMDMYAQYEPLI